MKLLLFDDYKLGVLKGDRVVDGSGVLSGPTGGLGRPSGGPVEAAIERWDEVRPRLEEIAAKEQGVPLSGVKVLPPLPRPHHVLCAFANYLDREGATRGSLDFFHKGGTSVIGSGGTVELPDIPEAVVFQPEPELGYVIGKQAKRVPEAAALDHVFGYLNFVDISGRGIPNRRTTFLSKELDTWAPTGPVIVTRDEVGDPQNMRVRLWINGEQKMDYRTSYMSYSVAEQIAWLTQYVTLSPGDIVSCGVFHVGLSPINDGDAVEMEIEGLERLRFSVKSYGPRKTADWAPPGVAVGAGGGH